MHEPADPLLEVAPVDHQAAGATRLEAQGARAALLLNHSFKLLGSIVAFRLFPSDGKSLVRFVVDDPERVRGPLTTKG
jgi:hypothetical protein